MPTMPTTESRPAEPYACVKGSKALAPADEELAALVQQYHDEHPRMSPVARVRRTGPVVTAVVDHLPAPSASLAEHLCHQLRLRTRTARAQDLAQWIIWNLDADGYLRENLGPFAAMAGATVSEIEDALAIVQSLEPTGVGARSLGECLLLQLRAQADPDPVAIQLVSGHLKALAEKRHDEIAQRLQVPVERIAQALAAIRRLEPRPGRPFGDAPAQTVDPEVSIVKAGDAYRVDLRDDAMPDIRVSRRQWMEAATESGDTRSYLAHRLKVAGWLISSLERRRHTLRAVVESIVRRQPDFLAHGASRLRPLALREVAGDVGVHESTVSRAVAHRYVDTPHGVFPLRFFFTNRLPADPAGVVSSQAARQRIREIVDGEDPTRPLADGVIAGALAATGIRIARRTVVKYRDLLGIAAAPLRRSLVA
jgi:RNA polymerase sigma-54 factor